LPFPDYGGLPPGLIDRAVETVAGWLEEGHTSYVHCRAGWQRSPAIAAALIALRDGVDIDEALAQVQLRKPSADPLPHQRDDLWQWWQSRVGAPAARPLSEE
jgi:protein-tyrosine phosphatase